MPYADQLRSLREDERLSKWHELAKGELERLPRVSVDPVSVSAPPPQQHVCYAQERTQRLVLEVLHATRRLATRGTRPQRLDFSRTVLCAVCGLPTGTLSNYLKGCYASDQRFETARSAKVLRVCQERTGAILKWLCDAFAVEMAKASAFANLMAEWGPTALGCVSENRRVAEDRRDRAEKWRLWQSRAWRAEGWKTHSTEETPGAAAPWVAGAAQSSAWIQAHRTQRAERRGRAQRTEEAVLRLQALGRGVSVRRETVRRRQTYRAARRIQARWRGVTARGTPVHETITWHLRDRANLRRLECLCRKLSEALAKQLSAHQELEGRMKELEARLEPREEAALTYAAAVGRG